MLVLLFQSQRQSYAIESHYILEVIPSVPLKPLANVPDYLLGLLDYHGKAIPVIDFSLLINKSEAIPLLHTRIILLHFQQTDLASEKVPIFGLRAEKVTETLECSKEDFLPSGVEIEHYPFLGGVWSREGRLIQLIEVPRLLDLTKGYIQMHLDEER